MSQSQMAVPLVLTDEDRGELVRWLEGGLPWLAGLADHDRPGRPVAGLVLPGQERDQLARWARRAKTSQALALRD
jgi:hypothetical protein